VASGVSHGLFYFCLSFSRLNLKKAVVENHGLFYFKEVKKNVEAKDLVSNIGKGLIIPPLASAF